MPKIHSGNGKEPFMKKRSNVLFFILIICAVMTVFTCKQSVGLGPQVDVVPPGGKITYPDAGHKRFICFRRNGRRR